MANRADVHEIYTVRALACLTIVLLHSLEAVANVRPELEHGLWTASAVVLKFGTPVFVMVSAFVLAYSYSGKPTPPNMFRKRAAKLLPPFVIIGAFYAGLSWYTDDLTVPQTGAQFAENMVMAGYHGYFILIVLQFILIFKAFKRISRRVGTKAMIIGSLAINAGWLAFFNFVPAPAGDLGDQLWHRVSWLPFPGWLFFFTVAYYLGANLNSTREMVKERAWEIIAGTIAATVLVAFLFMTGIISVDSSKRIDMLVLAPLAFLFFFLIGTRQPGKIKMWVSANSFGIYLLHFFYIAVMDKALSLSPIPLPDIAFAIALFVSSTLLSGITTAVIQKIPFGQLVVGPSGRRPADREKALVKV